MDLLPYIYYHFKSISKFFQIEIIAQLESITLFSHSSEKKAPSWLTQFWKVCLSETENSNGISICEVMVIAVTRIIRKYWTLNIWNIFKNFVVNFGVLKKYVKYCVPEILNVHINEIYKKLTTIK